MRKGKQQIWKTVWHRQIVTKGDGRVTETKESLQSLPLLQSEEVAQKMNSSSGKKLRLSLDSFKQRKSIFKSPVSFHTSEIASGEIIVYFFQTLFFLKMIFFLDTELSSNNTR